MEKDISADGNTVIQRLMHLGIPALQQTHRELFGNDCAVIHILYMRRKLAWELQARAGGEEIKAMLEAPKNLDFRRSDFHNQEARAKALSARYCLAGCQQQRARRPALCQSAVPAHPAAPLMVACGPKQALGRPMEFAISWSSGGNKIVDHQQRILDGEGQFLQSISSRAEMSRQSVGIHFRAVKTPEVPIGRVDHWSDSAQHRL